MRPAYELKAVSEHLVYEVEMLRWTGRAMAVGLLQDTPAHNAFLESFTTHARAILHFFDPIGAKPDDALAEHFYSPPDLWATVRGPTSLEMSGLRRRASKEIVHLTYRRIDIPNNEKVWHTDRVLAAINGLVLKFAKTADPSALPADLRQRLQTFDSHKQVEPGGSGRFDPDVSSKDIQP